MFLYTDSENIEYAYKLFYTRKVKGVSCARTSAMTEGEDLYAPSWVYEQLSVLITDDGIVDFHWVSPVEVIEEVAPSTQLMTFQEIMDIFHNMAVISYEPIARHESLSLTTLAVDKIELGLQRISEPDSVNSGLLIPAWSFYGEIITTEADDGTASRLQTGSDCIFTINAIDGSIIDLIRGY